MTTFVYQAVGELSFQGQFDVDEDVDFRVLVEKGVAALESQLAEKGAAARKPEFLVSRFSSALVRDFLTKDQVDLGEIEVVLGGSDGPVVLELIPVDASKYEAVKMPFPGDALASQVIADLRAYHDLGPNVQIVLMVAPGGQEVRIAGNTAVKDFPARRVHWSATPYA